MPALAEPDEVRAHLIAAARAGTALTYSELLEQLGYAFSRPKMRQLCAILGAVDELEAARGEPELAVLVRSEEHTSELQSLMRISYAVFCLKKKKTINSNISIEIKSN